MKRNLKRKIQIAKAAVAAGFVPDLGTLNQFGVRDHEKPRRFTDPLPARVFKKLAKQVSP